jgi:hypothetical protein
VSHIKSCDFKSRCEGVLNEIASIGGVILDVAMLGCSIGVFLLCS